MEICYIDEDECQIGMTQPYNMDSEIKISDDINVGGDDYIIQKIEIIEHYIMVSLTVKSSNMT